VCAKVFDKGNFTADVGLFAGAALFFGVIGWVAASLIVSTGKVSRAAMGMEEEG